MTRLRKLKPKMRFRTSGQNLIWIERPAIGSSLLGRQCGERLTLTGINKKGWLMLINENGSKQSGHPSRYQLIH